MPDGTGRNVYLIRQHVDRLYGEYLVRAVVIAPGPGRAVKDLLRYVRTHHPAAIARRCRLTVVPIGENAPTRIDTKETDHADDEAAIVAVVLGRDDRV
jgi:hypothetical protein